MRPSFPLGSDDCLTLLLLRIRECYHFHQENIKTFSHDTAYYVKLRTVPPNERYLSPVCDNAGNVDVNKSY